VGNIGTGSDASAARAVSRPTRCGSTTVTRAWCSRARTRSSSIRAGSGRRGRRKVSPRARRACPEPCGSPAGVAPSRPGLGHLGQDSGQRALVSGAGTRPAPRIWRGGRGAGGRRRRTRPPLRWGELPGAGPGRGRGAGRPGRATAPGEGARGLGRDEDAAPWPRVRTRPLTAVPMTGTPNPRGQHGALRPRLLPCGHGVHAGLGDVACRR